MSSYNKNGAPYLMCNKTSAQVDFVNEDVSSTLRQYFFFFAPIHQNIIGTILKLFKSSHLSQEQQ